MTSQKSWICPVDEEGVITFPDELMEIQGWEEGDTIHFDILPDNTMILTKIDPDETSGDPEEFDSKIERKLPLVHGTESDQ